MKFIKILSLNVRGLRNHVKRRALFLYPKNQKADFYCLQETFSNEVPWASEWSHGTKHSRYLHIAEAKLFVLLRTSVY